ncbi:MAG: precorrin-6y C5,15-methyltransferase (decarboxylating) subunit CbiE [Vallitaleaceae bacterium]|nr:precorrin-6y C5,15-methyltransferase (decarboxylating) subunit CbiE [Vallitaleaceae bacterium]
MSKVKIVGLGPGHKDYTLPAAYRAIEEANLLVGSRRSLEPFQEMIASQKKEVFYYQDNLQAMVALLQKEKKLKNISVVVTGDPGFYSLLDFIKKHLEESELEVIPGISSFQYLFSRLKRSYKEYGLYSLHGREINIKEQMAKHAGVFLLTDGKHTPSAIANKLVAEGLGQCNMVVGEDLSYPEERITKGKVLEFINQSFSTLCVVVIENEVG